MSGCGSKKSYEKNFLDNGYTKGEDIYTKTISSENVESLLSFAFTDSASDNFFAWEVGTNILIMYFYNDGWGAYDHCFYDYEKDEPQANSNCSDAELASIKATKVLFEKELSTLGLTIDDLN